jgi:metal-responsive CopG/Arc/MetJ family transcriptional regulator
MAQISISVPREVYRQLTDFFERHPNSDFTSKSAVIAKCLKEYIPQIEQEERQRENVRRLLKHD